MGAYWKVSWILFGLFVVVSLAWLHRVPGLMGDEASEGENVYQLLELEKIVVTGERSYIGPAIDYVRLPFIKVFGYTPLALRLVVVVFSLGTFWLAASVLRRLFGDPSALFGLAFLFFSPIYLTQQRMGWAITLLPFFGLLLLFVLTRQFRYRPLIAGLVAGVGLSNHVLFLPTVIAITVASVPPLFLPLGKGERQEGVSRKLLGYWPAIIGFIAGFGMQFAVLLMQREDQGDVGATTKLFWQRLSDLPDVLPLVISGSSYVARYTGTEFAPWATQVITFVIVALAVLAIAMRRTRKFAFLWALGIAIQLIVLMYIVDRYTLRYFVVPVLGIWALAGVGLGTIFNFHFFRQSADPPWWRTIFKSEAVRFIAPIAIALGLTVWAVLVVLVPFLRTGGSTAEFSLGNRTDTAAALVDTRGLIKCLRRAGSVSSENIHILNRLQFVSHRYQDLAVLPEEIAREARWLVEYRDAKHPEPGVLCPELEHFRIVVNP